MRHAVRRWLTIRRDIDARLMAASFTLRRFRRFADC